MKDVDLFKRVLKNEFDVDDMDWLVGNGYFVFRKTPLIDAFFPSSKDTFSRVSLRVFNLLTLMIFKIFNVF